MNRSKALKSDALSSLFYQASWEAFCQKLLTLGVSILEVEPTKQTKPQNFCSLVLFLQLRGSVWTFQHIRLCGSIRFEAQIGPN